MAGSVKKKKKNKKRTKPRSQRGAGQDTIAQKRRARKGDRPID